MNEEEKIQNVIQEDTGYDIPLVLRRKIIDIMNDCPTLVKVGEKKYVVKNLRAYSLNRILKVGLRMIEGDNELKKDKEQTDSKLVLALCSDLEASSEIVAIILCNHLFAPPEEINNITDVDAVMDNNDKMIKVMKGRIMMSTVEPNQWAAIILGAIQSIDLTGLFMTLTSAKHVMASLTGVRKNQEEQLQSFREALSEMQATSSGSSHNTP